MEPIVGVIWWIMLLATFLLVGPALTVLLHRAYSAARNIERYTADVLNAGVSIANNTANVQALKDTIAVAGQLLEAAGSIERYGATAEAALATTVPGDGQVRAGEM